MINTIFYFVPTFEEYQAKWNSGEISPRTIVFVADIRAIYKNGIRYGGYNTTEFNNAVDERLQDVINSINTALESIAALNHRVDILFSEKQDDIQRMIDDTFREYEWLKKNLGDVFAYQGFVQELNGFLSAIGNLTTSSPEWSTLIQTIDSITARVVKIEGGDLPSTLEALIKAWISDGVSGIDLSTYALKGDLNDYLRIEDFNTTLNGASAFINLRSDVDSAKSVIGAWGQSHGTDDTITKILGALQIQVNNLQNSVTTELSSTVRSYLDTNVQSQINSYLQNQSGLILNANLDSSVAHLFSQTSETKNAIQSWANTAGFIATSDFGSATATQYATNGNDLYAALTTTIRNDSSFLTAVANSITIKGNQIDIDATHQINLSAQKVTASNLNVINGDKTVAYIDDNGYASFIDGHIYIPYTATNWASFQTEKTVGLYVDSVATGIAPADVTYANAHWTSLFHPRTLIEPDGLRFENSSRALTGVMKTNAIYGTDGNSQTVIETYETYIKAYDPNDNTKYTCISMQPALIRQHHQAQNGYCHIYNYKSDDVDPTNWQGLFHVDNWHSIMMEAYDEIVLKEHRSQSGQTGFGISLHGKVCIVDDTSPLDGNGVPTVYYRLNPASDTQWTAASDERIKTIIDNVNVSIEDIAATRLVKFMYHDTDVEHVGTIAQDWQNIVPEAVSDDEGRLFLDYTTINTVSAITAAREIVKLKQENEELKQRLAAIEARLGIE